MPSPNIDADHTFDPAYAKACGVQLDKLLVSQPDTMEQSLEIAELLARSGAVTLVVIDSGTSLTPSLTTQGEQGDEVGLYSRLMSQALRKLTAVCYRTECCLIVTTRSSRSPLGDIGHSVPSNALKFYASMRILLTPRRIMTAGVCPQTRINAKVLKNKAAPPFGSAEFNIVADWGINQELDTIEVCEEAGLLSAADAPEDFPTIPSSAKENSHHRAMGIARACEWFRTHPEQWEKMKDGVRRHYGFDT
jgi:recombination protein RecA